MSTPSVSIIAPAYNESENLTDLTTHIHETLSNQYEYELIIVDDGSTDETHETLTHLTQLYPTLTGITLSRNYGQTTALQAGIDHTHPDTDVIVLIDADLQNDPTDIPHLIHRLQTNEVECVNGYRQNRDDPLSKKFPSWIQTRLAKLTGPEIDDYGCTLSAYDAGALRSISLWGDDHRYIPAKLHDAGYKITQHPVTHNSRENGDSKYGVGRLFRGFTDLVWHVFWNRYSTRPFHLYGTIGFLVMALGGVVGLSAVVYNWLTPIGLEPFLPQLLLAVGMVLFGLLVLMFGVIMEFLTTLYYEDKQIYTIKDVIKNDG